MKLLRLIIRPIILVWLLLASITLLIRLQPFDDGGLRALFITDNCSSPCFLGIQPGITTALEARDLLEKRGLINQWIEPLQPIDQQDEDVSFASLRWRWSINRPALLTSMEANLVYDRKTGLVMSIGSMGTRLSLGNLLVDLGQPSVGYMTLTINDRDRPTFTHVAGYPRWHFNLVSNIQCPMTVKQLWETPVTLEITDTSGENSRLISYPSRIQIIMDLAASGFC